jgi:hypothetical protein
VSKAKKSKRFDRRRWLVVYAVLAGLVIGVGILGWTAYEQGDLLGKVVRAIVYGEGK